MAQRVAALAHLKPVLLALAGERRGHLAVSRQPVPVKDIEVLRSALQEHAQATGEWLAQRRTFAASATCNGRKNYCVASLSPRLHGLLQMVSIETIFTLSRARLSK